MITTIFLVIYFTFILTATINFNSDLIPLWIIISPVFAIFIILILVWIMTPLYKFSGKNNRFFSYVTRSASKFINMFLLRMKLTIVGSEKIPKDKNIVFYSSHKSYSDVFVLLSIIKRPVAFTPKKELFKIPIISGWLDAMGCFRVDRANNRDTVKRLDNVVSKIKNGLSFVVFPEGGTKYRNYKEIIKVRVGSFRIAARAEASIIPVKIYGNEKVRKRFPFFHTDKKVKILDEISFKDYSNMDTNTIAKLFIDRINSN